MKKVVAVVAVAGAVAAMLIVLFYVGRAIVAATSPSTEPLTAEEQQRREACDTLVEQRQVRRQAAREAEIKDPAWASTAEQKVSEYASRRFAPGDIEVIAIDCRTSSCTFTLRLLTSEARGKLSKAVSGVLKDEKMRSDFWSVSASRPNESVDDVFRVLLGRRLPKEAAPEAPDKEEEQLDSCVRLLHQWQYRPD